MKRLQRAAKLFTVHLKNYLSVNLFPGIMLRQETLTVVNCPWLRYCETASTLRNAVDPSDSAVFVVVARVDSCVRLKDAHKSAN